MTSKRAILSEVMAARDEARLRLHLCSMEARERWYELETALDAVEWRLQREGDGASLALGERAREVTRSVRRFLDGQARSSELGTPASRVMRLDVPGCLPYASLTHACVVMHRSGCNALPVLDQDGKLLGVVTEHGLCQAACLQGKRPSEVTVDLAMTENVRTCAPEDELSRVLEIMSEAQARELPVVDEEGRVLGIITWADLVHHLAGSAFPRASSSGALLKALVAISAPTGEYSTAAE